MGRQGTLLLALTAGLAACAGGFDAAARLEARGAHAQAAAAFKRFALDRPEDPRAAEALVRAGRLLGGSLGRCPDAVPLFERAARAGVEPWAGRARAGLLACPDYFPLGSGGRWEYVDSATGGRNMREVVVSTGTPGTIQRTLYAGVTVVRKGTERYERSGWAVRDAAGEAVLRFPFVPGTKWRSGRLSYEIVSADATVRTRAGTFAGCLKVKGATPAVGGAWKFDYYCPGVGRAATTVGGPGFESPNTELKEFAPPTGTDVVE